MDESQLAPGHASYLGHPISGSWVICVSMCEYECVYMCEGGLHYKDPIHPTNLKTGFIPFTKRDNLMLVISKKTLLLR